MRYRKPFTPRQRQHAVMVYRSWRAQIAQIRENFRPSNNEQLRVSRAFRKAVRDFAAVIRVADDKVDVARLNELKDLADALGIEYVILKHNATEAG